jgi:cytochrome c-type biogenesis protein CcmH
VKVLVVLAAALAVFVPAAVASENHPTLAQLEGDLMCPTCKTPLAESNSPAANRIRVFVVHRIQAGDTRSEIMDKLVAQFGPEIRAAPARSGFDLLAWLLPLAGLLGGAVVLGFFAWRWRGRRAPPATTGAPEHNGHVRIEPELERRLDEELARFD